MQLLHGLIISSQTLGILNIFLPAMAVLKGRSQPDSISKTVAAESLGGGGLGPDQSGTALLVAIAHMVLADSEKRLPGTWEWLSSFLGLAMGLYH